MIITENLTIGDKSFTRYFSDENVYIVQNETGTEYSEAIDIAGVNYTYSETDKPIDTGSEDEQAQKAEAYDYITGRSDSNE